MKKTYRPDAAKITACFKEQERNPVCMGNSKSLRQRAETEVLNLGESGLSLSYDTYRKPVEIALPYGEIRQVKREGCRVVLLTKDRTIQLYDWYGELNDLATEIKERTK